MSDATPDDGTLVAPGDGQVTYITAEGARIPQPKPAPGPDAPLDEIEQYHGFVFGVPDGHDTTNAAVVGNVTCNNPACERQGQQVVIHADTVQPVMCGGCGRVVKCDHERVTDPPEIRYGGTLAEPVRHEITSCLNCGSVLNHVPRPVSLSEVPLDALFQPKN